MDREACLRMLDLYERFSKTEEYQNLLEAYCYQDARLQKIMGTMTQEQFDVVLDYLGTYYDFYDKLIEFVCRG